MLANLLNTAKKRLYVEKFTGLCHKHIEPFYICDMENICTNEYPALATREKYFALRKLGDVQIFDRLMYVKDGELFHEMRSLGKISNSIKSVASLGNKMLIMPDKLIYDSDYDTLQPFEQKYTCHNINISLANEWAEKIEINHIGDTEPTNPKDNEIWLDTSKKRLKRFVGYESTWNSIESIYTVLMAKGIEKNFDVGDIVNISGSNNPLFNWSFRIENMGKDYITILAKNIDITQLSGDIIIQRLMPHMDKLCTWQGRVWGINNNSHELYASKLGSIGTFNSFSGLASDSYCLSLEEKAINLIGYEDELLVFFETGILRITGNRPSNYTATRIANIGLMPTASDSLVAYHDKVYFVSQDGIYAYNGMFRRINEFCPIKISRAKGFGFDGKYFVASDSGIYSYNITNELWAREASYIVKSVCVFDNRCYFLSDSMLFCMNSEDIYMRDFDVVGESALDWYIETGPFSLKKPNMHTLRRIAINMQGEGKYKIEAYIDNAWIVLKDDKYPKEISISVNISLAKSNITKLRISGKGRAIIYSITQEFIEKN